MVHLGNWFPFIPGGVYARAGSQCPTLSLAYRTLLIYCSIGRSSFVTAIQFWPKGKEHQQACAFCEPFVEAVRVAKILCPSGIIGVYLRRTYDRNAEFHLLHSKTLSHISSHQTAHKRILRLKRCPYCSVSERDGFFFRLDHSR